MKFKITGRLVIQEEFKLQGFLPKLELNHLEKYGYQDTLLESGNLKDVENSGVLVRVTIRNSKNYLGIKLMKLSI